eukprot:jgi/Bigna1/72819/fgenesh1_pg.21_\
MLARRRWCVFLSLAFLIYLNNVPFSLVYPSRHPEYVARSNRISSSRLANKWAHTLANRALRTPLRRSYRERGQNLPSTVERQKRRCSSVQCFKDDPVESTASAAGGSRKQQGVSRRIHEHQSTSDLGKKHGVSSPGHVFVVQGDLRTVAADAVLYPTRKFTNTDWFPDGPPQGAVEIPESAFTEERRVHRVHGIGPTENHPRLWLGYVAKGDNFRPVSWYLNCAWQYLHVAVQDLTSGGSSGEEGEGQGRGIPPKNDRSRHLLALPVIGTGEGNARDNSGQLLSALLKRLYVFAARTGVDIVLVVRSPQMFSDVKNAFRRRRRRVKLFAPLLLIALSSPLPPLSPCYSGSSNEATDRKPQWSPLPPRLVKASRKLAEMAIAGEIVFFIGAGCSSSGGLPDWKELLQILAKSFHPIAIPISLSPLLSSFSIQRAIERRYATADNTVIPRSGESYRAAPGNEVQQQAGRGSLLSNIPVDAIVTTNYDTMFEDACRASQQPIYALPYEVRTPNSKWILKLHGDVNHPEDIVLTREQVDRYDDRRKALSGIVQALLITKHMLFVGFSLQDENFHKVATTMRTAFNPPHLDCSGVESEMCWDSEEGAESQPRRFGTVLSLTDRPFLEGRKELEENTSIAGTNTRLRLMMLDSSCSYNDLWPDLNMIVMDAVKEVSSSSSSSSSSSPEQMKIKEAARLLEIFLDRVSLETSTVSGYLLDREFSGPALSREEWALKMEVEKFISSCSKNPAARKAPGFKFVQEMIERLGGDPSEMIKATASNKPSMDK